jgi:hypothetical protein
MEIKPNQLLVRIRPQRIAVLVEEHIDRKQILSLIAFLSRIWGGRYSNIVVVTKRDNGLSAKRCLSSIRPEVILGVGIDGKEWARTSQRICQPRAFAILNLHNQQIKEFMRVNFEGLIWADNIVWAEIRESPEMKRENLRLLKMQDDFPWSIFMAASFGLVPENKAAEYAEDLNADVQEIDSDSDMSLYLQTCTEMSKKWSWLDFANYRLDRHQIASAATFFNPIIVIVKEDEVISDIALFWNLRMQFGPGASGRVVLFSEAQVKNASSVKAIVNWLDSSPVNSNYCELVSTSCNSSSLEALARRIRPRLKKIKSRFAHVDVREPIHDVPIIIPYDREIQMRPFVSNRAISIEGVKPFYEEYLPSTAAWICDLVKDNQTGRVPYEIYLPPRESALQVLNAPDPPRFRLGATVFGFGIDSINVRFTKNNQTISFRVPSPEELLEEVLIESGVQPAKDEKRIRYTQTIDMFGGLLDTARFFSGISLKVLKAFKSEPLTYGQIKAEAKIGKNKSRKAPMFLEWVNRLPKHSKNVAKQRYFEYSKENLSLQDSEIDIIEKLIDRGVLRRKWKLDKCPYCDKDYWVDHLEIHTPMICPGCRKKIPLRDKFQLGYKLNELVGLSIREGIIPVVLTARFLYNLTSRGFFWLPGMKCSGGSIQTDFDILACCDGHLIATECKTLTESGIESETWIKLADQVKKQIAIGRICGIEILIVAAMCNEFPKDFKSEMTKMADQNMSIFLLNKNDLLEGHRHVPYSGEQRRLMRLDDIFPPKPFSSRKKRRKRGERVVTF